MSRTYCHDYYYGTRKYALLFTSHIVLAGPVQPQQSAVPTEQFGLEHLSEYLGLKPDDISFRSDYTEPDQLRLKLVADLMNRPLGMIDYAAALKNAHVKGQPEILAGIVHADLLGEHQVGRRGAFKPVVDDTPSAITCTTPNRRSTSSCAAP